MHSFSSLRDLVVVKMCSTLWSPRECPCELNVTADSVVLMSPKLKVFAEGLTLSERYTWHRSDDSVCSLGSVAQSCHELGHRLQERISRSRGRADADKTKALGWSALGCKSMICALPDEPFFGTEVAKGGWRCLGHRIWRVLHL